MASSETYSTTAVDGSGDGCACFLPIYLSPPLSRFCSSVSGVVPFSLLSLLFFSRLLDYLISDRLSSLLSQSLAGLVDDAAIGSPQPHPSAFNLTHHPSLAPTISPLLNPHPLPSTPQLKAPPEQPYHPNASPPF